LTVRLQVTGDAVVPGRFHQGPLLQLGQHVYAAAGRLGQFEEEFAVRLEGMACGEINAGGIPMSNPRWSPP
jgi:hypothetical protein